MAMMLECSLETCLERNTHRTVNRISEDVIHHLYKQYEQDKHCNGTYQIHGHRNNQLVDIPESKYSLNVDGHVEKGGQLRFVVFNTDNTVTACSVDSIEKEVFKK